MICVCAPVLDHNLDTWVAMGGGNSGCCGNKRHVTGYHREASSIPTSDYSRRYDSGTPFNMSWACAGDFHHGGNPALRAKHAEVLARLMSGDPALSTVVEFIGQPWANQPVYYWFIYNGRNKLKKYTGQGHDMWSHMAVVRSHANVMFDLWTPGGLPSTPIVYKPPTPNALIVDGDLGPKTIRKWQQIMGTHVDGIISTPSQLVRQVQIYLNDRGAGLTVDGKGIRQDGRKYKTVAALQHHLNTPVDGRLSSPKSMAVQALQRRLNQGGF